MVFNTILRDVLKVYTVEPRLSGLVGPHEIDRIIEGPDNRKYEY